ncbi:MAG: hypothetical protein CFE37_00095 [Alphaproteobacteria bacterium PA4]|nr:MAG: hypothetical protein CFE37_00095 [Alphaproteobacteria bacterium PA4]
MVPADSLPKLKRRIDDYLRETAPPIQRLREMLDRQFKPLGPVAIIGGMVRDFARKGKVGFRSDIDLVIDAEPSVVTRLAAEMDAKPNRFGGFSSKHPHWKVDFWSLPNTWASAVGLVQVHSLADLVHTTFFDCDAICYEIKAKGGVLHARDGYLERIAARTIDVNLLPNPSIDGNLLRAARRILLWGFTPGPSLRQFIERELNQESFLRIVHTEQLIYPNAVVSMFSNGKTLVSALLDPNAPQSFAGLGEQLELPGFND